MEYTVNGRTIKSIEARGNGGQYIFVIPELQIVVAITSGNYQSSKSQQPETIFGQYILPALMK
jgi:CubicO group peptidase (beta-lactamase class C family)